LRIFEFMIDGATWSSVNLFKIFQIIVGPRHFEFGAEILAVGSWNNIHRFYSTGGHSRGSPSVSCIEKKYNRMDDSYGDRDKN
jgi:hypothetical protein